MTARTARLTLTAFSLILLLIAILIFVTGRVWSFPLDYDGQEEIPLIQLTIPPFVAILASTAAFIASPTDIEVRDDLRSLLALLVWGMIGIFAVGFLACTWLFYVCNQPGSQINFTLAQYRGWLTILLSIFTAGNPLITTFLYKAAPKP
jgi:hypothetical protein